MRTTNELVMTSQALAANNLTPQSMFITEVF